MSVVPRIGSMAGSISQLVFIVLLLLVAVQCGTNGTEEEKVWLPNFKHLLQCYSTLKAYFVPPSVNDSWVCTMTLDSMTHYNTEGAQVFFECPGLYIKMTGFSKDNETLIFNEAESWGGNETRTGYFEGQTYIGIAGSFGDKIFDGNASSLESENIGRVILMPEGRDECQARYWREYEEKLRKKYEKELEEERKNRTTYAPFTFDDVGTDTATILKYVGIPLGAVAGVFLITAVILAVLMKKGYFRVSWDHKPAPNQVENGLEFVATPNGNQQPLVEENKV